MSRISAVKSRTAYNPMQELKNGEINHAQRTIGYLNHRKMQFKQKITELEQFFKREKANMTEEEIQLYINGISELKNKYKQF